MALKPSQFALAVAFFGCLSFVFGVIAENKKPASGTPIPGKDVVICKFPNDPTIALGILSVVALIVSALLGVIAVFFPYKGKSVPKAELFRSTALSVFFAIAVVVTVMAGVMMLCVTVSEATHRTRNVHHNLETECPTAKTGLFGGAAFLALDAALFWLVCQMLTDNARSDYLDNDEDPKGNYGQVATDYETKGAGHPAPRV